MKIYTLLMLIGFSCSAFSMSYGEFAIRCNDQREMIKQIPKNFS